MARILRFALRIGIALFIVLSAIWAVLALLYSIHEEWAGYAAAGYVISAAVVLSTVRRRVMRFGAYLVLFLLVLAWWSSLKPSMERSWAIENSRIPSVIRSGDLITIQNVRNFHYRTETDFTPAYEDRTYDLQKLHAVDLFISYWGSQAIAHTILSFAFTDGQYLAVSIETRKESHETYSAIAGFFRQYELMYVAADERDLIRLRTNFRNEDVYLYRLAPPPDKLKAVFLDYVKRIESLSRTAEFYNALLQNCTTSIYFSFQVAPPFPPLSLGIILPGYLDQFIWQVSTERKLTNLPFEQFREQASISSRARSAPEDASFSRIIRKHLP